MTELQTPETAPNPNPPTSPSTRARTSSRSLESQPTRDRSLEKLIWYRFIQTVMATFFAAYGGWRATGRHNLPRKGGALLVSNHLSYLDVFVLGIPLRRPLNYVARSTLFVPVLGTLMRSVGGFPIQRDGMGASGLKETLRRLKNGGIVALFPEGTRSRDGSFGEIKPGIAVLVSRARVPVVPTGLAGTFEAWPRSKRLPRPYPIRIHYGPPIQPAEIENLDTQQITALIASRMKECQEIASRALQRDLQTRPPVD
jgi:1-acyl-sn-glycerol-3-phosphate acyltransferase